MSGVNEAAVSDPSTRPRRTRRRRGHPTACVQVSTAEPATVGTVAAAIAPEAIEPAVAAGAPDTASAPDTTGVPDAAGVPDTAGVPVSGPGVFDDGVVWFPGEPADDADDAGAGALAATDGRVAAPSAPARVAPTRPARRRLAVVLPAAGIATVLAAGGVGIGALAAQGEAQPGDTVSAYLTQIGHGQLWAAYQRLCGQTLDEHATAGHAYGPGDFQNDLLAQNARDGGTIRAVSVTGVTLAPTPATESERDVTVLVRREHAATSRVYRVDRHDGRYCLRTI
ncbi:MULTISPECIES: hypothetical protein [Pseudofrankia]|uniref:hypothetical protein n=1 Tax=Pseudofrankia TaxID=2994363 RepID=UPI000234D908|nr:MULTISPECIES: hypothetical protein [Pseudofrankia]OHV40674.1 hypothetical protein BCD49_09110 [Pseudofrankia sp. EUN1h]